MDALTPEEKFQARYRMGLSVDLTLRMVRLYTKVMDRDLTKAIVMLALSRAGVQHIEGDAPHDANGAVDDSLRKPIGISALARSLALPKETVRRHVNALVEGGHATRMPDGKIFVLAEDLDNAEFLAIVQDSMVSLRRLMRAVEASGDAI